MPIAKVINTLNGTTNTHRVVAASFVEDPGMPKFNLQVNSFATAEDAEEGVKVLWQEYAQAPATAFDPVNPFGGFEQHLAEGTDTKYSGGTYFQAAVGTDLDVAKARKWEEIKAKRQQVETGGFDAAGLGRFDSDSESREKIIGAVTGAHIAQVAGQPFSIDWTLADNTPVTLGAGQMILVGLTLLAHIDQTHQKSRGLYAEIQAAETVEAVSAVVWDAV